MGTGGKRWVLLADDTKFFRAAFREALETAGCQVEEAEDGAKAIEKLSFRDYDLAVLDQVMPGATGTEIVTKLHSEGRKVRVILLSGVRAQGEEFSKLPPGAVEAVLDKARPLEELVYAINNIFFSKTENAREWPRTPVKTMAQYRAGGTWQVGRIWDLSHTGLQLRTSTPLPAGTTAEIKFFLPRAKIPLEAKVKVHWAQHLPGQQVSPHAHGLSFLDIPAAVQKELTRFVDERVAELVYGKTA